jgi:hypothetical protein
MGIGPKEIIGVCFLMGDILGPDLTTPGFVFGIGD